MTHQRLPTAITTNLAQLILALRRVDLCHLLGYDRPENYEAYAVWLITEGVREYRALREDFGWRATLQGPAHRLLGLTRLQELVYAARPDVQRVFEMRKNSGDYVEWFFAHGVAEHDVWVFLTDIEKAAALSIARHHARPAFSRLEAWAAEDATAPCAPVVPAPRPFGVNLIGYAYGQLGIGEDLRMTALALQAAGIPFAVVNFPPGAEVAQNDRSMAAHVVDEGPYAINIFCMTALETGRFYAEHGLRQFAGRYNIGYWPWELSQWPRDWTLAFGLVDEVWGSTAHIRNSLLTARAPAFGKPLHVMPLVAEVPNAAHLRQPEMRAHTRKRFGLPKSARLFCFSFDLNSSIHRKNPQAVVDAFVRAFPPSDRYAGEVGLVVKVQSPRRPHRTWGRLKALAAADSRIHIIEGSLPRDDLLALYAACDCFVSLHRAEGFGRGMAEALQLGLHLIATDYSGNTDFCRRPEFSEQVSLVPFRLTKVRPGQYPYGEGQVWASPSLAAAAAAMRRFVEMPQSAPKVPAYGWPCFSAAELGAVYATRLRQVFSGFNASIPPSSVSIR
jgi:glycosyltransferase involved in cell wall biosynthesis